MKNKHEYIAPRIEIIDLDTEMDVMMTVSSDLSEVETYKGGAAGAKERNFWGE